MAQMELMAPAGSFEAIASAVKAGANSIYFGIEQLNMRARSSINFTLEDLPKIVDMTASKGVKSYITLNTIIYDHDLRLMREIVDASKAAGVNAIIASDHAVMSYCRRVGMPVHISTQANITNIETVEFYSAFADVMVMARELSLKQVADIVREIERRQVKGPSGELVRIEIFGHGALCMAVSGKCYLSLHSHNASANRGACIQNCRRSYIVIDKEEGYELEIDNEYIMSAKDLCTIDFLDKIIEAGVSVLKIEGRGRSADYVYVTTRCYREAIDSIAEGTYTPEKIAEWKERLATVYNRGFWDGYYLGRKLGEWSKEYGSAATKRKIYLGRGRKYFDRIGVAEFEMETHSLRVGDEIMITGPTTGFIQTKVEELRIDDRPVEEVKKGDIFSVKVPEKVRPSDKLYKVVEVSQKAETEA
ncbi:putative protease [Thermonema lapsum]|uniref:Putative protease n=1 Tax=Thermonema lapsum TaxID=28195 RepID=A0A846MN12_9BACT|nr:U32 family peptidase [Thermonema lapsum]NIK72948.1 putative protease [Thermonema lapsum]